MKQLPDKFQMRTNGFPGFTHTVKLNAHGDYEVTWARGFDRKSYSMGQALPNVVFTKEEVRKNVAGCVWYIVEDKPKQEKTEELPDEFYCTYVGTDKVYKGYFDGKEYRLSHPTLPAEATYHKSRFLLAVKDGRFKILDKKPLTAEQQRTLKEFKEQVAQLDQSIKLNEQDISHKQRLISNYIARQDDLHKKIEELEGK
jgi:hypothetical protein